MRLNQIYSTDITIFKLALILNIETSTKKCSVALFDDFRLISEKSLISDKYSHSENLTVFIEEIFNEIQYSIKDLDAISVSKGPGSYTGLRIGVSTAKGLSYALNKPLISISTLKSMAYCMSKKRKEFDLYCPMIDARRMEVFSAFYNQKNELVREVKADIIELDSYTDLLNNKILFFGDGSSKCKDVLVSDNAYFEEGIHPSAIDMSELSYLKYKNKEFEDIAYFEPFYLKDFIPGVKK